LTLHEVPVQRLPGHNYRISRFDSRPATCGESDRGRLAIY
jgi:hypothetical protein